MEEPHDHLSPQKIRNIFIINFTATGSFFMLYLWGFPLSFLMFLVAFYKFAIIFKKKTMTDLSFILEQEPCHQSSEEEMVILFNVLMIGSILLFFLLLLFPNLGLFRGLCNFLLFGFFSLTIIMIFIFADDPEKETSWLLSNKIDKDERKPGDHIYTWRGGYAHHGICVEDRNVIHFVRGAGQGYGIETGLDPSISKSSPSHSKGDPMKLCTSCGDQSNLKGVISSCIECFLSHGDLYLFQYSVTPAFFIAKVRGGTCTLVPSDPLDVVLKRAKQLHRENGFGFYHILNNNCESFAYYCKTKLSFFSGQVVFFLAIAVFLVALLLFYVTRSLGVVVAEGFVAYCACRYMTDKGSGEDGDQRLKAPVERLRLWVLWDFGLLILSTLMVLSSCLFA